MQFYVPNLFYVSFFWYPDSDNGGQARARAKKKMTGWTLTCLCMTVTELSSNGGKSKPNSQPGHQARLYILNSQSQKGQLSFIVPCLTLSSPSWLVWFGCKSRDSLLLSLFFSFAKEMAKHLYGMSSLVRVDFELSMPFGSSCSPLAGNKERLDYHVCDSTFYWCTKSILRVLV